jgi:hypothetical protein
VFVSIWNDSNRLGKAVKLRLPAVKDAQALRPPAGSEWQKASANHDTKYLVVLGQPGALVSLVSRCRDHRLWHHFVHRDRVAARMIGCGPEPAT